MDYFILVKAIFWGVIGGGILISLGLHAYTFYKHFRTPDNYELNHQVESLRLTVTDLVDRVDSWQRRDKTREARAKKAAANADEGVNLELPMTLPEKKALLRKKAAEMRGGA